MRAPFVGLLALTLAGSLGACLGGRSRPIPPALYGRWQVSAYRTPGVSAMSADDAQRWVGKTLFYDHDAAKIDETFCKHATYRIWSTTPDSLFLPYYNIQPLALDSTLKKVKRVTVNEVSCAGESWANPGGQIILIGRDRGYTVWDGVFFEMRRHNEVQSEPADEPAGTSTGS